MALSFSSPLQVSSTQLHPAVIEYHELNGVPLTHNVYAEDLNPNITVLTDRSFEEDIKVD